MLFRKEQVAARSAGISSCFASQELAQLIAEGLAYSWSERFADHCYQQSKQHVAEVTPSRDYKELASRIKGLFLVFILYLH